MELDPKIKESLLEFADKCDKHRFEAGEVILKPRRLEPKVGFIIDGIVKASATLIFNPKKILSTINIYGGFQWIGFESAFEQHIQVEYKAITDSYVALFESSWVQEEMPTEMRLAALRQYAMDSAVTGAKVLNYKTKPRLRLLFVLTLIRDAANSNEIPLTLKDMSDLTGMPRTAISPLLRKLEKESLIKRGYGKYQIANPEKLKKVIRASRKIKLI